MLLVPSSRCRLAIEQHVEPEHDVATAEQPAEREALERRAVRRPGSGRLRLGRRHERGKKWHVVTYRKIVLRKFLILPDTQDGTVPHRGRPAHIPWAVGEHKGECIMLVCKCEPLPTCHPQ